jgi:hypothetical protein
MSEPRKDRSKLHSLVGIEVAVFSLDGNVVEPAIKLSIEEVSPLGLLFRGSKQQLIFASTAAFTTIPPAPEPEG